MNYITSVDANDPQLLLGQCGVAGHSILKLKAIRNYGGIVERGEQ